MKKSFLSLFFLILINASCDPIDTRLSILNNSNTPICFYLELNNGDTLISDFNPFSHVISQGEIPINEYVNCINGHSKLNVRYFGNIENDIKNVNDTLSIYLFDFNLLKIKNWEEIKSEYEITARYDLSISNLNKLDWVVEYPPSRKSSSRGSEME